jgi:hypothetical protein
MIDTSMRHKNGIREDYTSNSWKRNKYYLKVCKLSSLIPTPKDIFEQRDKVLNDMYQDSQVDAREAWSVADAVFTMSESINMCMKDRSSPHYAFADEDGDECSDWKLVRENNQKEQEGLERQTKEIYKTRKDNEEI